MWKLTKFVLVLLSDFSGEVFSADGHLKKKKKKAGNKTKTTAQTRTLLWLYIIYPGYETGK